MEKISAWIYHITNLDTLLQAKIFSTLIVFFVLWAIRSLLLRVVLMHTDSVRARYSWRKMTFYVAFGLGTILIFRVWFEHVQSLATYFGLLSAGLSIALKDMVADIAAWFFIVWHKPFEVGDRIQIEDSRGDVIDIGVFQFTILEIGNWVDADHSTGRMIQIPNGKVLSHSLANYTQGFQYIWNEIAVLVTFESNWQKAKQILQHIIKEHAEHLSHAVEQEIKKANRQFMIYYSILTPTVYTSVKDSGVMLTMRYLCKPRRRRDSEQSIWEDVLTEFAKCPDIDMAYPTERRYNHVVEGKPACRPDE